jgi:hypothetical protein
LADDLDIESCQGDVQAANSKQIVGESVEPFDRGELLLERGLGPIASQK